MPKKAYASARWMSVEPWKAKAEALRQGVLSLKPPEIDAKLRALHEDDHFNLRNLSRSEEDEFYFLLWARDWCRR